MSKWCQPGNRRGKLCFLSHTAHSGGTPDNHWNNYCAAFHHLDSLHLYKLSPGHQNSSSAKQWGSLVTAKFQRQVSNRKEDKKTEYYTHYDLCAKLSNTQRFPKLHRKLLRARGWTATPKYHTHTPDHSSRLHSKDAECLGSITGIFIFTTCQIAVFLVLLSSKWTTINREKQMSLFEN